MKRHPERQRGGDRQGQQDRPALEDVCQHHCRYDAQRHERDQPRRMVPQIDDLVGVPLVTEDQDWEEREGDQHRD
jgi:hypothetical protein